ncbi:metallophosphoesterase [Campylobacter sp. RM12640]|uniref:metallophosphoesterase n=1 Tax=unclassified Campylobacter TaxID=2593542 RepID=UPI0030158450|nr:metallophosphoesterase [Campylobacter sp. RM12640]MBZ7988674.1 metallophosphoesterase [Campylobacter sp. RM12635]
MAILLGILYFLLVFFANANMLLRTIKNNTFNKFRKIIVAFYSIIFAFELSLITQENLIKELLYYSFIILIASTIVFFMIMSFYYIKTKIVYEEHFAKAIDIWEIFNFFPIFFILIYYLKDINILNYEYIFIFIAFVFFYKVSKNAIKVPKIKEINLNEDKLKKDLKIAMIADIHLKKNLNDEFFINIINKINSLNPDLVVIVGDLVDTGINNVKNLNYLNELKSTYGTFYVLGNHEYYHGVGSIAKELKKYKLHFLDNKSIEFDDFVISGVNDLMGLKLKTFESDISKLKPKLDKFNILLTHQPKFVKKYDVSPYDLILAGHTHAGQIFPFSLAVKLEQGYLKGLYNVKNSKMYVTSGAGFWGIVARFNASSEIVLINVKSK